MPEAPWLIEVGMGTDRPRRSACFFTRGPGNTRNPRRLPSFANFPGFHLSYREFWGNRGGYCKAVGEIFTFSPAFTWTDEWASFLFFLSRKINPFPVSFTWWCGHVIFWKLFLLLRLLLALSCVLLYSAQLCGFSWAPLVRVQSGTEVPTNGTPETKHASELVCELWLWFSFPFSSCKERHCEFLNHYVSIFCKYRVMTQGFFPYIFVSVYNHTRKCSYIKLEHMSKRRSNV
jgi:hypothetical protein